jgi:hypothetical protein
MASGRTDAEMHSRLKRSLRAYSHRDTWAVVRLHQALEVLAARTTRFNIPALYRADADAVQFDEPGPDFVIAGPDLLPGLPAAPASLFVLDCANAIDEASIADKHNCNCSAHCVSSAFPVDMFECRVSRQ